MQRCENKSANKEGQSCRYACKQRRPLGLAEHWYQRKAEKDVSDRQRHVLPATVADLRKQILNCEHCLPRLARPHDDRISFVGNNQASSFPFPQAREPGRERTIQLRDRHAHRAVAHNRRNAFASLRLHKIQQPICGLNRIAGVRQQGLLGATASRSTVTTVFNSPRHPM